MARFKIKYFPHNLPLTFPLITSHKNWHTCKTGVKGIQIPWNISPPSIDLHGVLRVETTSYTSPR